MYRNVWPNEKRFYQTVFCTRTPKICSTRRTCLEFLCHLGSGWKSVISLVSHAYENRAWTKCRNFFVFVMAYFANKANYREYSWRYKAAVFFMSRTRTSWTSLCIFYPANMSQFLKHSCTSGQFWRKYGNFENGKISTLSKKIKNWWMA